MAESNSFERRAQPDAGLAKVARLGVTLAAILVVVSLLLGAGHVPLNNLQGQSGVPTQAATQSPEITSGEALKQLRATEEATLTTYGWVNRKNGIVHIPIDRAIELLAQRGLPARP